MSESRVIEVRMAKASADDLSAAKQLVSILDQIGDGSYPFVGEPTDEVPLYFDADDPDHVEHAFGLIVDVLNLSPGFPCRVVHGMATLLAPENNLVDPDADHLAPHPDLISKSATRKTIVALRSTAVELANDGDEFAEHAVLILDRLMGDLGMEAEPFCRMTSSKGPSVRDEL